MSAERFANCVIREMVAVDERAGFLKVRARGGTAVLGYDDEGEWVPVFRVAHGSGAYNVANLQVRQRRSWQSTLVRGTPAMLAEHLLGPFRFLWEQHALLSQSQEGVLGNYDQEH
jgi:hypothetical protein